MTEVREVEGGVGDFRVTLVQKPRYILEEKCTGCTTCVEYCPVHYPDPFNQELSTNKAVHIYYAQAIPLVAYIDESCLYLKERKCRICEGVCKNNAIDFQQTPRKMEINVGAIVLAPGFEPFDPAAKGGYGYGKMPNVVTSMDFERLLCATGPFEGEILRPSDKRHPHKLAWIQCVGSRRVTPGDNSYCSAVCCTYTQKQVILAKDHDPGAECTVFHNDIRSYGKDFERFCERTEKLPGVRFIRSYVSVAREDPVTHNVAIRYSTPAEGVQEEEFDLVVLSVGLNPPAGAEGLARRFGIELTPQGFCKVDPLNPVKTSRPGVFVSGAFQGPVDIPESVFAASGAGSQIGELLDYRRGKLARERRYPPENSAGVEEPRIGVFVCHCGANIGRIVNVPATVDYARSLPHVAYAQEQLFSCATNCAKEITDLAREKGLNRVVIAACSPRTLEPLFRDTLREAGLNQYFLDMANIREQCSWVHSKEKDAATRKAKDIVRMSVARAGRLEPLQEFDLPVNKAALVVGGGIAGMTCALSIAGQGHAVHLVEKAADLGGIARKLHYTLDGLDIQGYVRDLERRVYRNPSIRVYTGAEITAATGYVGNFETRVRWDGRTTAIQHGAAVLATGADLYTPAEYLYGQDARVMTHLELEGRIAAGDAAVVNAGRLVMIQCVGCRNAERNYCSRICCSSAVKNALKLKALNPGMEILILYRDMMTYGFSEDGYREASQREVKFVRYEPQAAPRVESVTEGGGAFLRVSFTDPILGRELFIDADLIALAAAVIPSAATRELAALFKVSLGPDGFFKEAHVKLRPVEFAADGVYLCGLAHYPKHIPETIKQAYGAAGRVLTLLSHDTVVASGSVCEVAEKRCMGCGECIAACTYGAIEFRETKLGKKAVVNPILCKGDGLCNAKCPTGAIVLKHFTDEALLDQIDATVEEGAFAGGKG
ncbi:MAG: FAD-dependent oxidoreductase [Desulfobacterales bacterium]|nr:FAD-dependent oxidoreductase [Desulfobacterales bacterium]